MTSKKVVGIILVVFLQLNIAFAQNSFEIEGVYSLTSEKLISKNIADDFDNQLFHSFGVNGKKIFKSNIFIRGGLYLKNFGAKYDFKGIIIDDMPEEISAQSIDIPIDLGFYFFNRDKLRLGMSLGCSNGLVFNQSQKSFGTETGIKTYEDYILRLNSSLEMGIELTDNITLDVRTVLQRQINSNFGFYKQKGIGCQIGISYDLTVK